MASFVQSQLDALEAALVEGTLIVKYADKQVQYRSVEEMLKLRDLMRSNLGIATGTHSRVRPYVCKGLE